MAIGFTPKHEETVSFEALTREQFTFLCKVTIDELGWTLLHFSSNGLIAATENGAISWNAELTICISEEGARLTSESSGNDMIDFGKNKATVNKFIIAFEALKPTYTPEVLATEYAVWAEFFVEAEDDILAQTPTTFWEDTKGFLQLFVPSEGYIITPILMNLCILVFLLMAFSGAGIFEPTSESLLAWGGNLRSNTLAGEPWRLLTCCFVHIGIFHLLMNLFALLFIGLLLEPFLGKNRFAAAYLLTGIAASATSLWWHESTVSAGASGAIFGLYGVFLAILTTNLIEKEERNSLLGSIGFFVVYNLFMGLRGGVDNAAHLGGLLSGLVVGYIYVFSLKDDGNKTKNTAAIALAAVFVIAAAGWVYTNTTDNWGIYDRLMTKFSENETSAQNIYQKAETTELDSVLLNLKNKGILNWEKNIKIVDEVALLSLPEKIKIRNTKIKKYAQLRLEYARYVYQEVAQNKELFTAERTKITAQIDAILEDLNKKEPQNPLEDL